jgi:hypothetical protein
MPDIDDLFGVHDTRDELGIGSVRDAFADTLFPGTGTIMTGRGTFFSSAGFIKDWKDSASNRQR